MFSRNHFPVEGKAFIVTGGSLGLGRAIAVELAKRGASRILLVARGAGPLAEAQAIVSRAATHSAAQIETFSADLTDAKAARDAVKAAGLADDSPVDGVFCVAGTSRPGLFASLEPEAFSTAMALNYMTAVNVAHAAVREWVQNPGDSHSRHLIFFSSAAALMAMTGYSPYTPTKAAIRSLADTLRQEGLMYGFKSHIVYPQKILSPGFADTNESKPPITTDLEAVDKGQTPEVLALRVITELEHGRFTINAGFIARSLSAAMLGPSPLESIWDLPLGIAALLAWPFVRRDQDAKVIKAGHDLKAQSTSGQNS